MDESVLGRIKTKTRLLRYTYVAESLKLVFIAFGWILGSGSSACVGEDTLCLSIRPPSYRTPEQTDQQAWSAKPNRNSLPLGT